MLHFIMMKMNVEPGMSIIPAPSMLSQEDLEFEASLSYCSVIVSVGYGSTVSLCNSVDLKLPISQAGLEL